MPCEGGAPSNPGAQWRLYVRADPPKGTESPAFAGDDSTAGMSERFVHPG